MRFAITLALLLTGAATWPALSEAQDQTLASVPQARAVSIWLSAVKKGDQEQLKTAFSESMRRQFDQEGWAKVLMTYQDLFRSAFGDYTLEDFSFAFTGGEDSGHVLITFKGMVLPGLRVIRENTDWKVNERCGRLAIHTNSVRPMEVQTPRRAAEGPPWRRIRNGRSL